MATTATYTKLFSFPPQPPYVNSTHLSPSKPHRGINALHGPGTISSSQTLTVGVTLPQDSSHSSSVLQCKFGKKLDLYFNLQPVVTCAETYTTRETTSTVCYR